MKILLKLTCVLLLSVLMNCGQAYVARSKREIVRKTYADADSVHSLDVRECDKDKQSGPSRLSIPDVDYTQSPSKVATRFTETVNAIAVNGMSVMDCSGYINGVFADMWKIVSGYLQKGTYPIAQAVGEAETQTQATSVVKSVFSFIKQDVLGVKSTEVKDLVTKNIFSQFDSTRVACGAYAKLAAKFSEALHSDAGPDAALKQEMKIQLPKCYQLLAKSSHMFDYSEHAAEIYVAKIPTDLLMITFLRDALNYSQILEIDDKTTAEYFVELERRVYNTFDFIHEYVKSRIASVNGGKNLTSIEYEMCKAQRRVMWFGKLLFPYGTPEIVSFTNNIKPLNVEDNADSPGGIKHMQYLINYDDHGENDEPCEVSQTQAFLNCAIGLANPSLPKVTNYHVKVNYLTPRTYELRILYYFEMTHYSITEGETQTNDQYYYPAMSIDGNNIDITFSTIKTEVADHTVSFKVTNMLLLTEDFVVPILQRNYAPQQAYSSGVVALANMGFFDVLANEGIPVQGKMTFIQEPGKEHVFLHGFDLIVHNYA